MSETSRPIVVTGAAGFIGSHVCEALLRAGRSVMGVDNFDPYYGRAAKERNLAEVRSVAPGRFEPVELDVCDAGAVLSLFRARGVSGVIHLAGRAGVRPSIDDPVRWAQTNVVGTASILDAAHRAACGRVVIASSSSVYGNCPTAPFAETADVSEPISPYAATKRACELIAFTHWHLHRIPTAMLRFFTVFGPRQRPDLAISLFLNKVSRGEPLPVFGDPQTSRDYTFVGDTVAGILAAYERIDRFGYRVWNLGHDHPVTLAELIETVGRVVGRQPVLDRQPSRAGDVERTWADLSRSRAELGYQPSVTFEEGVARQWAWMRQRGL